MEAREKVITTFFILVFLIAAFYLFSNWFSKTTGYGIGEDPDNYLARCLTENGAKLYTSESCPDCKRQESLLGTTTYRFIYKMDCSKDPSVCSNLKTIPAWYINNTFHYGIKTTAELKELSGCKNS